jgi:hypothetical protein
VGTSSVGRLVDHALEGASDNQIVVGPLVWQPTDGATSKIWYFVLSTCEQKRGWRCDQIRIATGDEEDRELIRARVITELAGRKGLVIHNVDNDEVYAARLCEALWPGERISRVRREVEADYASRNPSGQ